MTKPRALKTIAERKAELIDQRKALIAAQRKKQKQLSAKLAQLDAREKTTARKQDSHLKIIIGAAAMAHAKNNGAWAKQLFDVLHKAAKDRDRQLIEAWFKRLAEEQKQSHPQVVPSAKQQEG